MATVKDDMVLRLLCHLAWLRDTGGSGSKQRTLAWARRVYNSTIHLQFRFVYPHQSHDRVAEPAQQPLAKALEAVVVAASEAVEPLRSGVDVEESVLDTTAARVLLDRLNVLLETAAQVGWGGVPAPKEDVTLDRPVNPMRLLSEWRRRRGGGKQSGLHAASVSTASDEAVAELCKGVATQLVANHSRVMGRVPASAAQVLHEVADAHLSVDVDECGRRGGDQVIQRLAAQLLRTRSGRAR
jgi:hypothetical protein